MKNTSNLKITVVGVGIALNVVGAFLALTLRLPIYLDSIGTIMVSFLLGPIYGVVTGILGSLTSGITFDIYSIYYSPVQIFTGLFCGLLYQRGMLKGKKVVVSMFFATVFISLIGAIITAFVFGGFTSSGSSYIVITLKNLGVNPVLSAFVVQFITDYLDKLIATMLMIKVVTLVPTNIKVKLAQNKSLNKINIYSAKKDI